MNPLFIALIIIIASVTLGIPIFFSLGLFVLSYMWLTGHSTVVMVQAIISGMNLFSLLALPLFLLAGQIMNKAGITEELIKVSDLIVGRIRGGLAHINILVSIIFAGISGAAVADASALGTTLIPMMEKKGYDTDFSVAVTSASSTIGPIIPPSIIMVLVGIAGRQSIGALFAAGFIPGILMGIGLMVIAYIISVKRDYPVEPPQKLKESLRGVYRTIPALIVPFIILGGITFGVFTPTEAAAVAVVYCLLYGIIISDFSLKDLAECIVGSCKTTATILWVIGAARGISWILATEGVHMYVFDYITRLNPSPYFFIFLINIFLLIVGCIIETSAALFILVPIILPLASLLGLNELHMAFLIGMNLCIGLTTPPMGLSLYVSANIGKISLEKASIAVLPFVAIQVLVLFIVSYIPEFVLWLPKVLGFIK